MCQSLVSGDLDLAKLAPLGGHPPTRGFFLDRFSRRI